MDKLAELARGELEQANMVLHDDLKRLKMMVRELTEDAFRSKMEMEQIKDQLLDLQEQMNQIKANEQHHRQFIQKSGLMQTRVLGVEQEQDVQGALLDQWRQDMAKSSSLEVLVYSVVPSDQARKSTMAGGANILLEGVKEMALWQEENEKDASRNLRNDVVQTEDWDSVKNWIQVGGDSQITPEPEVDITLTFCQQKWGDKPGTDEGQAQSSMEGYMCGEIGTELFIMEHEKRPEDKTWIQFIVAFIWTWFVGIAVQDHVCLTMDTGLRIFDGLTESFEDWRKEFEMLLGRIPIPLNQAAKIQRLRSYLDTDPRLFVEELPDQTKQDWDLLTTALRNQYTDDLSRQMATISLDTCFQNPTETMLEFATRLSKLMYKIHSTKTRQQVHAILLEEFIRRLRPDYRTKVRRKDPTTFDEAVKMARKREVEMLQEQLEEKKVTQQLFLAEVERLSGRGRHCKTPMAGSRSTNLEGDAGRDGRHEVESSLSKGKRMEPEWLEVDALNVTISEDKVEKPVRYYRGLFESTDEEEF